MKVAMICGLHPSNDSELIKKSIIMPQYAAHRTAAALAEGFYLHMQDDFTILNIPFVGSYPKQHKMLHVPSYEWVFMGEKTGTDNRF
ncbi:hypothetical protein QFZ77_001817 [Paenibacillus sp. V4I3]|uniref:hypothetical protein n=1 Tax=Paenibacillus sp. V4I3 TaxID=3042305 RepID=UPI00277F563C|nr:hypothetical protein [Paenibacillus sp. V4I3]MDQ0873158.1 hypothetical protein [Paenibacillus sp. V4I3]